MTKNILITAGGTIEAIDRVRSITNTGTGKLGSLVAENLAQRSGVGNIYFVHAKNSCIPDVPGAVMIGIESAEDLENVVRKLCAEEKIDAVVHSMAVSDYRVRAVLPVEEAGDIGSQELMDKFDKFDILKTYNKIPSDIKNPIILLEQTPKVLPIFRKLLPKAVIIGFKLLDNVPHEKLIDTAYRLLISNGCDYVLANDYVSVESGAHEGFLIDREKNIKSRKGKYEIADMIAEAVIEGGD